VVDLGQATLWFSSKELIRGKKLKEFLGGANEKSKVTVKLSTRFVAATVTGINYLSDAHFHTQKLSTKLVYDNELRFNYRYLLLSEHSLHSLN
jgi:Cilia- and flagella-associated protein 298